MFYGPPLTQTQILPPPTLSPVSRQPTPLAEQKNFETNEEGMRRSPRKAEKTKKTNGEFLL